MASPQGKKIKLHNVRLSFPTLEKAKAFEEGQTPSFDATFILDPKNPRHVSTINEIKAEIERMIKEMWGTRPAKMKPIEFMAKGDTKISNKTQEVYDGYAGMVVIGSKNKKRPTLKGRDGENLTPEEVGRIMYGGCYVNAIISLWCQDHEKWGKAIRCNLDGVKFHADGDAFGGGGLSDDEWDDFDDGEGAASDDFDV